MKILYSMCWEDPHILLQALDISNEDDVLSIVSGGENLFAINIEQIYLVKLKIAAIKNLDFEEFTQFLGFKPYKDRLSLFNKIKVNLTKEEINYWKDNIDFIKNADWIVDLGPEGGDQGGEIVAQGTPKDIAKSKKSYTGKYLK